MYSPDLQTDILYRTFTNHVNEIKKISLGIKKRKSCQTAYPPIAKRDRTRKNVIQLPILGD